MERRRTLISLDPAPDSDKKSWINTGSYFFKTTIIYFSAPRRLQCTAHTGNGSWCLPACWIAWDTGHTGTGTRASCEPPPRGSSSAVLALPVWKIINVALFQGCGPRSAYIFPPGSGSKREKLKNKLITTEYICKEIGYGNNYICITIFKLNLDQLHGILLFSNLFLFVSTTVSKFLWAAGSRSALRKKQLNPDPQK